jgi:molybdenum cofactor biosynthesis protein B
MKEHSEHPHEKNAPAAVRIGVLTVSNTRGPDEDTSGDLIATLAEAEGHSLTKRKVVKDSVPQIRNALGEMLAEADAVIITGGTGVTPGDVTIEAVSPMFDRELPAFGSVFSRLSYDEVGAAAVLSRAGAGIIRDRVVFCLPGSAKACKLAMEQIILPVISHLVFHIQAA